MDYANAPDSVIAAMMSGAANRETIASLWSSFITGQSTPGDTLRDSLAPGYEPPEILPKTVAFPGESIPDADYAILSRLGEGGMGVVFEARQNHLDRAVALKMIRPGMAADPVARACFFHEAVITAGLEHPGIIPVLEFGRDQEGRDFYVMKKAIGVPWSGIIRDRTLEENLAIFDKVTDVVAYAHARGVLHRDLKPSNVLLGEHGEVWVGDWGVAVARGPDGTYSHAHPGGTPRYMSPEMARGDSGSLGPRSDVYLLGAILFEMVAGAPPHPGADVPDTLLNAANNVRDGVGEEGGLSGILDKALSEYPGGRYPTVAALRDALRESLALKACLAHVETAERMRAEAERTGDYDTFQRTLAEYGGALAACPGNPAAIAGRRKAAATYARKALGNGEYDLALAVVEPDAAAWDEAASLTDKIRNARRDALRKRKRDRRILLAAFGTAFALTAAAIGVYLHSRDRLESVDKRLDETAAQAAQAFIDGNRFAEIEAATWRNGALMNIGLHMPRGSLPDPANIPLSDLDFERTQIENAVHLKPDVKEKKLRDLEARVVQRKGHRATRKAVVNDLRNLLEQIDHARDTADTSTDEGVTAVYRQLEAMRPEMQKMVETLDAHTGARIFGVGEVEDIRESLIYLMNQPTVYVLPKKETRK